MFYYVITGNLPFLVPLISNIFYEAVVENSKLDYLSAISTFCLLNPTILLKNVFLSLNLL